ncbi:MAG: diaminopimelate decarboxylase [Bacteroidetes bacterium]|nr:diaminopimelate decarboxylase [Bacteroidota bacterium]
MKGNFPVEKFKALTTPFYYYDMKVLRDTITVLKNQADKHHFTVHYAIKANFNTNILKEIKQADFGADCVSGGEIQLAIKAGINPSKIVFAGVGKADWEINLALEHQIFCFNVESIPELEVINQLAAAKDIKARIALRINPNVMVNTHHYITTGLNENKFGINMMDLDELIKLLPLLKNIELIGLHFHIGSQITDLNSFKGLAIRINEIQHYFYSRNIKIQHINVGGGLGIDYEHPNHIPIPDFESYFNVFSEHLILISKQQLHFELGRSIVGQCGSLVSRVLYIKQGVSKKFMILDAGMTDLIRPAFYQAFHRIENISSEEEPEEYDVVGPICESSDTFIKNYAVNASKRGDFIVLRSAGAYGEVMVSHYNSRKSPDIHTSDEFGL